MHLGRAGEDTRVVFFERAPFMSVELLDLLTNYEVICYADDAAYRLLREGGWNVSCYHNARPSNNLANDNAVEIMLEDKGLLKRVNADPQRCTALFFYMNRRIDQLLKDAGLQMLLPPYEVQERLGNKLYLADICEKINVHSNPCLIYNKTSGSSNEMFARCRRTLDLPFIVQGALGVSGDDTFLIHTEEQLLEVAKNLPEGLRATRYVQNHIPLSVHVCVLSHEIIIRGPFLQLVGIPELSANPFQFGGNDTNQSLLNWRAAEQARDMSHRIGEYFRAEEYFGIMGIDFIWDMDTGAVYPQELNTRLVGLTRLLTGMQKDQSVYPDILRHLEAFGVSSLSERARQMRSGEIDLSGKAYSQVIIRNNSSHDVIVTRYIEPSIYRAKDGALRRVRSSLFMHDMEDDDVLITYAAQQGEVLSAGDTLARILLKKSVIRNSKYCIEPEAAELVELIRSDSAGQ